ncbi:MAG: DUF4920 domain-containing protein [Myxococcota bacterium]|nr:DUF4920 domain-containing protein [Myxococcota bacterium]
MRPRTLAAHVALFLVLTATLGACSRAQDAMTVVPPQDRPGPPREHTPTAEPAPASSGTLVLGERITSDVVPLASIARDPKPYEGQVVATTGTVTAVCQEMGCWMEIRDASSHARVRMHGHNFFVPKTASGHLARVQARVIRTKNVQADCGDAPKSSEHASARVELDATGVELD